MKRQPSVLLADDDDSLRRVLEFQLGEAELDVTAVAGGAAAIEALRERPFDVVVTDLLMPDVDGLAVLDRARHLRPDSVVVVITAHGDVATAVRAMQAGALDFIEKPF